MIVTIEFNLPEETDQLKLALRGIDYFCALLDIKNEIRNHHKYDKPAKEVLDRIEEIVYDTYLDDIS
jgi:hypothetical protein